MSSDKSDLLANFRNLSLSQKCTIQPLPKKVEAPYVVQMAVQTGLQIPKVAAACSDNEIRILLRDSLIVDGNLSGHSNMITDVQFGKTDPNLLYSCSTDQTVRCWDLRERTKEIQQLKAPLKGDYEFLCVDSTHSDLLLCAGSETAEGQDTHFLFWDRRAGSFLGSYKESHNDSITKVSFKPGSDTLVASAGSDGIVCVFDITHSTEDDALQMTFNIESCVVGLGWCGDDLSNVYGVTSDHRFYAWDALEGDDRCYVSRESVLKENDREYLVDCISDLTTSGSQGNEALLLTGNYSGSLSLLWNCGEENTVLSTLSGGHTDTVRCLHWDAQTKSLLTGGEDSVLCLWSASDEAIPSIMGKMKISPNRAANKKKPYKKKS